MLIDTELEPITIELGLAEWKETLRELGDVPEIRGQILNQLLDVIGLERRGELTDQGMHHVLLSQPRRPQSIEKVKDESIVEDVNKNGSNNRSND